VTDMSESGPSEQVPDTAPRRRTSGQIFGSIILTLAGIGLLVAGIQAIVDPDAALAGSSSSSRMDSDTEAKLGGLFLCMFGISVLGFGIGLFRKKPGESLFGSKPKGNGPSSPG
jgi:hypothetical protein